MDNETSLITHDTRVLVQGLTGRMGRREAMRMVEYGTQVVAGVVPGKGGQSCDGIPVFDTVGEAVASTRANASLVCVPRGGAAEATIESIDAGLSLVVVPTEGVPQRDAWLMLRHAERRGCRIVGPNSMGIARPGVGRIGGLGGDQPGAVLSPGPVAVFSRSGGMTTEICWQLTRQGIGQSIVVSLGGAATVGTRFADLVRVCEDDDMTRVVALFGEVGGTQEDEVAAYLAGRRVSKPIVALIGGLFAEGLQGVRFGHSSAIIERGTGSVSAKNEALRAAGAHVVESLDGLVKAVSTCL